MLPAKQEPDGSTTLSLSTEVYPLEAIQKTAFKFTRACTVVLTTPAQGQLNCNIRPHPNNQSSDLLGEFANELLDQVLRLHLRHETEAVRRLILAQAFSQSDRPNDS